MGYFAKLITRVGVLKNYLLVMDNSCHIVMQSYPARALDRKLQVDWARDAREGPRVLMSLRVDFGPMG